MRISSLLCEIMTLRKLFNTTRTKDLTRRSKISKFHIFQANTWTIISLFIFFLDTQVMAGKILTSNAPMGDDIEIPCITSTNNSLRATVNIFNFIYCKFAQLILSAVCGEKKSSCARRKLTFKP